MDRNTITALVLLALLFITFNWMTSKKPDAQQQDATKNTVAISDTSAVKSNSSKKSIPQIPLDSSVATAFGQTTATPQMVSIGNEVIKLDLSNKGGRIEHAELKKYKTHDGEPLILIDGQQNVMNYSFAIGTTPIETQQMYFKVQQSTPESVTFRLYADSSAYVEQIYTLKKDSYLLDYQYNMVGFDKKLANGAPIKLSLQNDILKQEHDMKTERTNSGIYFKPADGKADYLFSSSDATKQASSATSWVAMKQEFFNQTLIAKTPFKAADFALQIPTDSSAVVQTQTAKLSFDYQAQPTFSYPMQWYIGTNHYQTLKSLDNDLEQIVPLGWGIFGWVNKFLIIPIFNLLSKFISNYGIIIILLTIIIKFALWPLTYRSYLSFAKMNVLKPELEELRKKYEGDAQGMQAAQMQMYSQAGVNPLGGCLPQLLQFPILAGMYRFFPSSVELRQASFLWAKDLSSYDSILSLPFTIPFYGNHVSLFCLLAAGSTYAYSRLNNQMTPSSSPEMAMQMKVMQNFMPIMLVFLFNNFASGLTFYFFLTNIISFGQQWAIRKYFIDETALHKEIQENRKKPVQKSGFQKRLDEAMEMQKQAKEQKNKKK